MEVQFHIRMVYVLNCMEMHLKTLIAGITKRIRAWKRFGLIIGRADLKYGGINRQMGNITEPYMIKGNKLQLV